MGRLTTILSNAQARAQLAQQVYAGELDPDEAAELLGLAPGTTLIDVRSRAELDLLGTLPEARHVEWLTYPGWHPNPHFIAQLRPLVDEEALLLFICSDGQRSHRAAAEATLNGYRNCYNILEGVEGKLHPETRHRGEINGWKKRGLPWLQK